MYSDLSLLPENRVELCYMLSKLEEEGYKHAAIDFEYVGVLPKEVPPQFLEIQKECAKYGVTLHSRATLILNESSSLHLLNLPQDAFDVLAVRPLNEKMFHSVCVEYDNYDLITLELTEKLPFMLRRNPVYEALRKGKMFELKYAAVAKEDKRIACLTNITNVIKACKANAIVVSSGANSYAHHRSPFDVIALLITLGLTKQHAIDALKLNCTTLLRAAAHRKYFKGIVTEIPPTLVTHLSTTIAKHKAKISALLKTEQVVQDNLEQVVEE